MFSPIKWSEIIGVEIDVEKWEDLEMDNRDGKVGIRL